MKCSKCGEELNEKWVACPFCGTEVPKAPKTIDEYLKEFVDDYGPSIFKEENSNRLDRFMGDWPDTYADDRDIIKLLQIKNIPDMLSSALDQSDDEKNKVVQDSANILCDKFGINGETASKMISLITNAIGLKTTVAVGNGMGTFRDPRDGQVYKTCKIGDQVWLAENLRYELPDCCVYHNDYQFFDELGYLYEYTSIPKAVPDGWRIPRSHDIDQLRKTIAKEQKCSLDIVGLKLINPDVWNSLAQKIETSCTLCDSHCQDLYGFNAKPGIDGTRAGFWLSHNRRQFWLYNNGSFSGTSDCWNTCYIRLIKD